MAKFLLLAGQHHYGASVTGNRVTVNPGESFEAISEKEADFCRQFPDRYQEIKNEPHKEVKTPKLVQQKVPTEVKVTPTAKPVVHKKNEETVEIDMDKLNKMNLIQLLQFARENGISLQGAMNRESVLKQITDSATEVHS